MKELFTYRLSHNGQVKREKIKQYNGLTSRKDFPVEDKGSMSERVLAGYYAMEIQHGSRFPSNYRKSTIRKAHELALARGEG